MRRLAQLAVLALAFAALGATRPSTTAAADPVDRWIVLLEDGTAARSDAAADAPARRIARPVPVGARVRALTDRVRVRPEHVFRTAVQGFSARMTRSQAAALRASDGVAAVIPDQRITTGARRSGDLGVEGGVVSTTLSGPQRLPTGLARIKADRNEVAAIGGDGGRVDADVAVLDSGIADHPDLAIAGGINCTDTGARSDWGDVLGHGTHVAGTIGALDNDFGVVGVAPGVRLWSVKIIGDDDVGWVSWAVCGLDWVAAAQDASGAPRIEAVNMSVGGDLLYPNTTCGIGTGDAYHQAVCRVVSLGIPVVVAAGNHRTNAATKRPAAYREAITVSALADFDGKPGGDGRQSDICPWYSTDRDDTFADFSDWGEVVDLIAPGKCILSTYPRGRYAWMSGTSMATPHVTGAVVLYRQQFPESAPAGIEMALRAAGTYLWAVRTDPDDEPDRLLDVTGFEAPPEFTMGAASPEGFLGRDGTIEVPVTVDRDPGQNLPIRFAGRDLPDGISVDADAVAGGHGRVTIRSTDLAQQDPMTITLRGTDGQTRRVVTVTIAVDAIAPVVDLTAPAGGPAILTTPKVAATWTVSDHGGSRLAGRTLKRETAPVPAPGTCAGADYGTGTKLDPSLGAWPLPAERCSRLVLTVRDGAGNMTIARSGGLLVDLAAPSVARLGVSGDAVAWDAAEGVAWFRRDTAGALELRATAIDPSSGPRSLAFSAPAAEGWSGPGKATTPPTGSIARSRAARAADTTISIVARDVAGRRSQALVVPIRADGAEPLVRFAWPPAEGATVAPGTVRLAWSEADPRSGVDEASRRLTVQAAAVASDGTCTDVAWGDRVPVETTGHAVDVELAADRCYRWQVTLDDRVGNRARVSSRTVRVEPLPLVVTQPVIEIARRTVAVDGALPLRFTWRMEGSTEVPTASARLSIDGGDTWEPLALADPTRPVADVEVAPGSLVRAAVRATGGDEVSPWRRSDTLRARLLSDRDHGIEWAGGWASQDAAGATEGRYRWSNAQGATARFRATARGMAWVTRMGPNAGVAEVRADGRLIARVDLRRPEVTDRRIAVTVSWPRAGSHTLTVRVVSASGRVAVDGFVVLAQAP